VQQHFQQRVTIALASGEDADTLKDIVSREKKQPSRLRSSVCVEAPESSPRSSRMRLRDRALCIGPARSSRDGLRGEFVFARSQLLLLGEELDQSGLPCSVDSDERDALAALDHEVHFVKNLVLVDAALAITFGDVGELGNDASAGLGCGTRSGRSSLLPESGCARFFPAL